MALNKRKFVVLNACIMIDNVNGFMLPKIEP